MRCFLASIAALSATACATPQASSSPAALTTVGIVAFNDFHGQLEARAVQAKNAAPDGNIRTSEAGGAARLANAVETIRSRYRYSATVSAGDLIGASPISSSLFLDEPTIEAMNRIGLDFNAVGNHEFDRGRAELVRMQEGGCEQHTMRQPCAVEKFKGADFGFLSASTFTETGKTLFPATGLKRFGHGKSAVALGFIGLTLRSTPSLVSAGGVATLTFGDEADAINAAVPKLKAAGADAIIVLIHQGGKAAGTSDGNRCDGLEGAILPILARLDPRVDAVVSGHTHQAYVCNHAAPGSTKPMLLTSAGSQGRLVTEIALVIDPVRNRVIARRARNHDVAAPNYAADHRLAAYVQRYVDAVRQLAMRPAGALSGPASRSKDGTGGALGNLIADAQLAATRASGAQIALTNPFGIRAPLVPDASTHLTFSQIYAAQPFGNVLVTRSFSAAQIKALLEQGVDDDGPVQYLAPSRDLAYCADHSRPAGRRIVDLTFAGHPLRQDATYRVTSNSFLAGGGDGFSVFRQGTNHAIGPSDLDALEKWLAPEAARRVPTERRVCPGRPENPAP